MKSILVIAAHPDDETLCCGGTMARLAREVKAVHVVFVADGVGARIAVGLTDQQVLPSVDWQWPMRVLPTASTHSMF